MTIGIGRSRFRCGRDIAVTYHTDGLAQDL